MGDARHEPEWPARRTGLESKDELLFGRITHYAKNREPSLVLTELIATLRDPKTKLLKSIPEVVSIIAKYIRTAETPEADKLAASVEWAGKKAEDKEQLIAIFEDMKSTQNIFLDLEAERKKRGTP